MSRTNNIERNRLDYILTDILPVELSELFSLSKFYEFLLDHKIQIDKLIKTLQFNKANNNAMFMNKWATMPLKYSILKGTDSARELNLLHPLSILNVYLFIECYQKELLNSLEDNAIYSLRYHKKNTGLFYKKRVQKISHYFEKVSRKIDRGVLQQTGAYFKIYKYNSVASFTNSRLWQQSNFKFKYFAKADYKACFDSIYTHTYKWIVERNVIDSKNASNSNLYITIDRILQNINGRSSNGLIVGPEFSRMIAEILLQQIDSEVENELISAKKYLGSDYRVFRYVDDIYIFANTPQDINLIINSFMNVSHRYLLTLNELKLFKTETPVILNTWISKTRELADNISNLFYSKHELDTLNAEEKNLLKDGFISIDRIKNDFTFLSTEFPKDLRYIVSFLLSTLLNNISNKKDGYNIFKVSKTNRAFVLLELSFYIYSFCPCFDHTQKLISLIVYMNEEVNFITDDKKRKKLVALFRRYSFIFERGNLNDLCNWFAFFNEYKISLDEKIETALVEKLHKEDNPILWANYLIYSRYHPPYNRHILSVLEQVIDVKISKIIPEEIMLQREFWYVIVFNNCPYLSNHLKDKMEGIISLLNNPTATSPSEVLTNLMCKFMDQSKLNQFFYWGYYRFSMSKQITYRTYQRTLFKQYKNKRSVELYGSLET